MMTEKQCPWCGDWFTSTHGNDSYCSVEHQDLAKKDRQKRKRDPIKNFIPILMGNHEIIEGIFNEGKLELTNVELEAYGLDLSLCRYLKPADEHQGKLMLDFGQYFLITDLHFLNFKIFKHETVTTI